MLYVGCHNAICEFLHLTSFDRIETCRCEPVQQVENSTYIAYLRFRTKTRPIRAVPDYTSHQMLQIDMTQGQQTAVARNERRLPPSAKQQTRHNQQINQLHLKMRHYCTSLVLQSEANVPYLSYEYSNTVDERLYGRRS